MYQYAKHSVDKGTDIAPNKIIFTEHWSTVSLLLFSESNHMTTEIWQLYEARDVQKWYAIHAYVLKH